MRLQKYMAVSGIASRRKSEEIIKEGRVKVNNIIITELGTKVDIENDLVTVDDIIIKIEENKIYIILNKPAGYTTTLKDKHSEKIIMDLINGIDERIYPVGRLDEDSEGLILLTNDGDFSYKLMHPSYEIKKTYRVKVLGIPTEEKLDTLRNGILLDNKLTSKSKVKMISKNKNAIVEITIHEGRNRQVRRMFDSIGHRVLELRRISLGDIKLNNLPLGKWRHLTNEELDSLNKLIENKDD